MSCAVVGLASCATEPTEVVPALTGASLQPFEPSIVQVSKGLRIDVSRGEVMVDAQVCARIGWLEQMVCAAGTREHESLLAVEVAPSLIHAALLMTGYQSGSPGKWTEKDSGVNGAIELQLDPPTGSPVDIIARWRAGDMLMEVALSDWVRAEDGDGTSRTLPRDRFVFAGSIVRANPKSLGPGEHYVADYTGSIVGLVTFGDEVIAFQEVIPDRVDVAPALWEAWTDRIPAQGTPIELVFRRRREQSLGSS